VVRDGSPGRAGTPANLLGTVFLVVAGLFYLYTACPEPDWIDSGELAVAAHTLGIPHPTPKVLYVLLSRLAVVTLPGPFFPLTCLSVLFVVCGLWFLTRAARHLVVTHASGWTLPGIVLLAASPLVWQQAITNEVHALQFALFGCALYLWSRDDVARRHLGLTYILCLSLLTHGTGVFLVPFWLAAMWPVRRSVRAWAEVALTAILGGSLILVLPIRSAQGPLLDWDHTVDPVGLWHHLTAWSYQGLWQANAAAFQQTLAQCASGLRDTLPAPVWLVTGIGLWQLAARKPRALTATLAAAAACVVLSSLYSIPDIDEYFLAAHVILALWTCAGLAWLASKGRWLGWLGSGVVLATVAWSVSAHWPEVNKRHFRVPTNWVRDAMETVDSGGVVLTSDWDHTSAWMYLRVVESYRPDATWIDLNLLRQSWYPGFLEHVAPGRTLEARRSLDTLVARVREFEAGSPFDDSTLESSYVGALAALSFGQAGPVYADGVAAPHEDFGVERIYVQGSRELPWGLLTRLVSEDETVPELPPWPAFRNDSLQRMGTYRTLFHLELYDRARFNRSRYEER